MRASRQFKQGILESQQHQQIGQRYPFFETEACRKSSRVNSISEAVEVGLSNLLDSDLMKADMEPVKNGVSSSPKGLFPYASFSL